MLFGIPYGFIKNKNTKDISEYYYKISYDSKEDTHANKLINYLDLSSKILFTLGCLIFAVLFFSLLSLKIDNLLNYVFSNAALRIQKYLSSFFITLFGIIFTAITIFISSKPKFSILFDTRTIIKIMKMKSTFSSCSICCLGLIISMMFNYSGYYLIKNEEWSMVIKLFSFWSSIIISVCCFVIIAKFLHSFIDSYFSDNIKQKYLKFFYKDIYKIDQQRINKEYKNDNSIIYLLNNQPSELINNESITFISTKSEYKSFSLWKKVLIISFNILCLCFFQFVFSIMIILIMKNQSDLKIDLSQNALIISCSISLAIHLITSIISLSTSSKTLILRLSMFNWGYKIENKSNNKRYYSHLYGGLFTKKKYNKYFKDLYNIIVILKRAITTSEKCAKFYLDQIISEINDGKGDYLLYGISLYLYQEKYKLERKYKSAYLAYLKKHNLNHELVKNNMCAVLEDIDRANEASPSNENKDKTEHEIKKQKIKEKVEFFFDSMKKIKIAKLNKKIKFL